jgi:DNA-binding NtrC family response regulator
MRRAVSTDGVVSLGDASRVSATILVVEDEVLVRLMLADGLRETGYTVIEAAGADEALAILQSGTKVHIVFTDINMPGSMDGIGLARIVCSKCPDIDVLLTSAHQGTTELDARIKGFFPKPYDMQTVLAYIKSLFEMRDARSNSSVVKE